MKWASALSERTDTAAAVAEAAAALALQLGTDEPDLVLAFVSPHHAGSYDVVPAAIRAVFPRALLLGCSASGVIGNGREVEARPALSLTAASLPGVRLRPLSFPAAVEGKVDPTRLGVNAADDPHFLILCDPYSFDARALVTTLDAAFPSGRKVGGMASGGDHAGDNVLYCAGEIHQRGAVGVALTGDIAIDTIVAQGCRPIGTPLTITRADGHIIRELNGKSPVDVLRETYESLDNSRDQELFRHSLFIGLELDSSAIEYQATDFLVRDMVGVDPSSGAIAVAANVRPWQVMHFLLRDARTAEHDLKAHLERYRADTPAPAGALLFSCVGRGMHLFDRPDHDTDLFRARVGTLPLGGAFCNGQIGPVGAHTFLHGYTSAFGLFRHK
ncbi:MAG TPA: FIST N-terminal domain-containing protein [Polyangia bacterium]|jgi:small ligand-binding sensory domain FIST|nr:FIST N-terminal domain-containing protein [Polyangia bacterium]